VPESGDVRLVILDLRGREVAVLKAGYHTAGTYQAVWNGKDSRGEDLASGSYFCRMRAGTFSRTRKIQLLR
jgi:flagellar hook assembly protein FlgD